MKRLIVLRHAKAVPHDAAPDFQRALNKRGRADAAAVGQGLAQAMLLPDLALVSPAQRTRETWALAAQALPGVPARHETAVYGATDTTLLELLRDAPDSARCIILVGHNPGGADLARALAGYGDRYARHRMAERFPTAAYAVLDFDVEHWGQIEPGGARLDRFVMPDGAED